MGGMYDRSWYNVLSGAKPNYEYGYYNRVTALRAYRCTQQIHMASYLDVDVTLLLILFSTTARKSGHWF